MKQAVSSSAVMAVMVVLAMCVVVPVATKPATSLEQAFIRAYNERVKDGSWVNTFGSIGLVAQDFCSGSTSLWDWPYPNQQSDLLSSLQNGVFRCMYNANSLILSTSGKVIINSTLNDSGRPSGAIVDWFDLLAQTIQQQYDLPSYDIVWDVSQADSDDILEAVSMGLADAACGRFSAGSAMTTSNVARDSLYSFMYCPTYLDIPLVWVRKNAATNSWSQLVKNVDKLGWTVCVPSAPGGGAEQTCTAILDQSSTTGAQCVGNNAAAFDLLLSNTGCDAVYGSAPTNPTTRSKLNSFSGPAVDAQGSFFRPADLVVPVLPKTLINVQV